MTVFNSYTVYNKEGGLIAHARATVGTPTEYFDGLWLDIQHQAHILLVLQEGGYVAKYMVKQPVVSVPTLGPREGLEKHD